MQAASFKVKELPEGFKYPDYDLFGSAPGVVIIGHEGKFTAITAATEYGQTDQFEKISSSKGRGSHTPPGSIREERAIEGE